MTPLVAICLASAAGPADVPPDVPMVTWPDVPRTAASAQAFVPRGWRVEHRVDADLDDAGAPDLVMILKGDDPACRVPREGGETFDTNPRIMLVARAEASGGYRLAVANRKVIMRVEDPYQDEPFDRERGLTVNKRVIRLSLSFWRSAGGWTTWSSKLAFRWDGARFAMIGADREELRRNTGETEVVSANYLTRRMRVDTGTMEGDTPTRSRRLRLTGRLPPSLETIGDALEFDARR